MNDQTTTEAPVIQMRTAGQVGITLEQELENEISYLQRENTELRDLLSEEQKDQRQWEQDTRAAQLILDTLNGPSSKGKPEEQDLLRTRLHNLLLHGVSVEITA